MFRDGQSSLSLALPVTQVCQAFLKGGYLGTGISLFLPFKLDNLLRGIDYELLIVYFSSSFSFLISSS